MDGGVEEHADSACDLRRLHGGRLLVVVNGWGSSSILMPTSCCLVCTLLMAAWRHP
jgi:hypothetical protein